MVAGERPTTRAVETPIRAVTASRSPVSLTEAMAALDPVDAVWTGPGEDAVITAGRVETLTAGGEGRFERIRRLATDLFDRVEADLPEPARPRLLGGFSFFGTEILRSPWQTFEPASFHLPAVQVVVTDDATWVTVLGSERDPTGESLAARLESTLDALDTAVETEAPGTGTEPIAITERSLRAEKADWLDRVGQITDTIRSSGLRKAVLAQAMDVEIDGRFDLGTVIDTLGETYPECYRFGYHGQDPRTSQTPGPFFVGASPEKLVSKRGTRFTTEALAGTVERGESAEEDADLEDRLRSDPKLLEEHQLVVDRIEAQLETIGTDVSVGDRSIRKLATVQHLHSPLSANAPPGTHVLEIVEDLHPTPAVGGMPPDAAKAVIRDSESLDRGWYAAPVGWFDADGDGTFAVGIRSALAGQDRATLFAGNGIVADSEPETEWEEVQLKFRPIQNAIR